MSVSIRQLQAMIGGSSTQPWRFFRTAASNTDSSTASTSSRQTEDIQTIPTLLNVPSTAVSDTSSTTASFGSSTLEGSLRSGTRTDATASSRLHSLTERKLEKAALGKAIGLRQLVLLSNAFASRSPSFMSHVSRTNEGEELDREIVDLEDDMDRKRREEDWLENMLDEMLTDEEDEIDHTYHSPRDRDFLEPYVHVSIKERQGPQSIPLLIQDQQAFHSTNFEPNSRIYAHPVCDSGFLEPALIPLPVSPETSPSSSAISQESDDGKSTISADDDDRHSRSHSNEGDDSRLASMYQRSIDLKVSEGYSTHHLTSAPISLNKATLSYMDNLACPSTPDLAYSVNSFVSNVSSSPPASIDLITPSSSPPGMFNQGKLTLDDKGNEAIGANFCMDDGTDHFELDLAIDTILPMEGLDDCPESDATRLSELARRTVSPSPASSLELVRYQPLVRGSALSEAFGIPMGAIRGSEFSTHLATAPVQLPQLPNLPPPLLSTLLGRILYPTIAESLSSRRETATITSGFGKSSTGFRMPEPKKLRLPILLPYEIVKSLYDSVDFGQVPPPRTTRATRSPAGPIRTFSAQTMTELKESPSALPPRPLTSTAPKSCPTSPRSRSKSLPRLPDGIEYDSSGSLLFSSSELYGRLSSASSFGLEEPLLAEDQAGQSSFTFGRGIVYEWERRRGSQGGAARTDSRSSSRLRLPLRQEDVEKFDSGTA